jgi:hypothetical protein
VYFVVVLTPLKPLPKGSHVYRGVGEGFFFYIRIIRPSHDDLDTNQLIKLGIISCDAEVPTTELCKYICAI